MQEKTKIHICVKCRKSDDPPDQERLGARLLASVASAAQGAEDVEVLGVECMNVCKRPVTVALQAKDKWTYVVGDFDAESAGAVLEAARVYGAASDGVAPWGQRPEPLKKNVVARVPPLKS